MGIRIVFMSDNHFGHNKASPEVMYNNLKKYLFPLLLNGDVDLLIIGGDFFDKLIHMDGIASYIAYKVILELNDMSSKHNFKIRVLRGTFSHDRDQVNHFVLPNSTTDVKIFNTMSIEYLDDLGIHIMYVPDDLPYDNAQSEIVRKIKEQGLTEVDVMVMHGYCKHEVPSDIPIQPYNCFDAEFLKDYVKGPILKGHIHKSSIYKSTINNGSVERFQHGEEEPKGFFVINYREEGFLYEFVENKNTYIFKTIVVDDKDIVTSFTKQIEAVLSTVTEETPLPIHIRYVCNHSTFIHLDPSKFDFEYPIRFSHKLIGQEKMEIITKEIIPLETLAKISRQNLSGLLSTFLHKELSEACIEEIFVAEEN